jgi:16S rRNA (cytidine1402-2'-O)-methyltransferase
MTKFCTLVAGTKETAPAAKVYVGSLKEQVAELVADGQKPREAIKEVAKRHQLKKQVVYNEYHEIESS